MGSDSFKERPKNLTITEVRRINSPHYFIIKYKSEEERIRFSKILMEFIKKFELKDFHIEEKKAFLESKIFYNFRTLISGSDFKKEELEKNFLKYFHN